MSSSPSSSSQRNSIDLLAELRALTGPNAKPISAEKAREIKACCRAKRQENEREIERERQEAERERQEAERERQKTERIHQNIERIRSKLTPRQAAACDASMSRFGSD